MKKIIVIIILSVSAIIAFHPERVLDSMLRAYLYVHGVKFKQIKTENFSVGYFYSEGGHAENIVLLHGLGAKAGSTWFNLLPELAQEYNVYAPDLLLANLVESRNTNYSLGSDALLVSEFMTQCGIEDASLIGLSVGGWLAAKLAAGRSQQCSKLILIDSAGLDVSSVLNTFSAHKNNFGEWFYNNIFYSPPPIPSFFLGPIYSDMDKLGPLCDDFFKNNRYLEQDFRRELSNIKCTTLILWGAQDRVLPFEMGQKFNRLIYGSELKVLDDCGHAVVWDKRRELPVIIKSFLSEQNRDYLHKDFAK